MTKKENMLILVISEAVESILVKLDTRHTVILPTMVRIQTFYLVDLTLSWLKMLPIVCTNRRVLTGLPWAQSFKENFPLMVIIDDNKKCSKQPSLREPSLVSSVPTIIQSWVRILSTPYML